jgi:hypothetical protein
MQTNDNVFTEQQKFRQVWVWVLLIAIDVFFVYAIITQLVLNRAVGTKPLSNTALVFSALLVFSVTLLFVFMKLQTRISEDGIHYQFFPFHRGFKKIAWTEIKEMHVRKYDPISEYGGWGPKSGPSGQAFNVSGNYGLQLVLHNGTKILVGTQHPDQVQQVIDTLTITKR